MKKDIPEIDTLLEGINDPDAILCPSVPTEEVSSRKAVQQVEPSSEQSENLEDKIAAKDESKEKYWNDFMGHLNASHQRIDKDERLNCKLDRDLADSLDDCNIGNRCRSDIVNAIIRTFFDTFLYKLVQYRRERKSLFQNYTNH